MMDNVPALLLFVLFGGVLCNTFAQRDSHLEKENDEKHPVPYEDSTELHDCHHDVTTLSSHDHDAHHHMTGDGDINQDSSNRNDSVHDHHHMHHHDGESVSPHDHHGHHHTPDANDMNHSGHMDHDMSHSGASHGTMVMYFHFSAHSTILFKGWQTTTWLEMLFSCIAIFVMAWMYEGLKVWRESLLKKSQNNARYSIQVPTTEESAMINKRVSARSSMLSLAHVIQTILHVLQVVISYFLMLIFMTYNLYICTAVVLGAGLGYFLFAWKRSLIVDINEHCH